LPPRQADSSKRRRKANLRPPNRAALLGLLCGPPAALLERPFWFHSGSTGLPFESSWRAAEGPSSADRPSAPLRDCGGRTKHHEGATKKTPATNGDHGHNGAALERDSTFIPANDQAADSLPATGQPKGIGAPHWLPGRAGRPHGNGDTEPVNLLISVLVAARRRPFGRTRAELWAEKCGAVAKWAPPSKFLLRAPDCNSA